jgi:glutamate formiminotransferase
MMSKIIAVVPNICEGSDQAFIDDLGQRLAQVPDLMMLDVAVDHVRNRTVLSFTGTKEAIFAGGMLLYERALGHIDMRRHHGEHPRVGAVDVFPFVPLKDATIEEAVAWSIEFAEVVAERFKLPVYLFAESARYRYRRDIENIRQGEYEGFKQKMSDLRWKPDLGPDRFPEDAGVTIIGARYPLISFKVFLSCPEEDVAVEVGHAVADTSGGQVRAYPGLDTASGLAMLTVSIVNFRAAPIYRVVENLRLEAARFGVDIRRIEMIGLIPEIVLIEAAEYYLRIRGFDHQDLLERNIESHLNERFVFRNKGS